MSDAPSVYIRIRNVLRAGLRTERLSDQVTVDYWTDGAGVEHIAGIEVLAPRGVEIDGIDLATGRPHGTGPEWSTSHPEDETDQALAEETIQVARRQMSRWREALDKLK